MPATRSPAQTLASRRNGARSKGPVTEEGKAKASRNAPKHGLCAMGRKSGGHGVIAVGSLS